MNKEVIDQLIKSLKKNRIEAIYFSSKEKLIDFFIDKLKPNMTVGTGDSLTLEQVGLFDLLRKSNVNFLDKYKRDITKFEKDKLYRDNFSSDLFLSGINAITIEGKIFNLDGNGSRVAPIIYGPKQVFQWYRTEKDIPAKDVVGQTFQGTGKDVKDERKDQTDKADPIREHDCIWCMACVSVCVITSYSIHYTKLYEIS